jgi:hypothetical protein
MLGFLLLGVALANLPLLLATPHLLVDLLPPDAFSHAAVAQAIARKGLPHGWVDVYDAGFPFGIHYQSVALLLDAALIKLGSSAMVATNALGVLALLAAPVTFAWATHRSGLHPLASLAGAIVITAVAPEHPMVGGWESYLSQGLLSQVVTIPILVVCASVVVSGSSPRWMGCVPWLGALAVAAHTQVTIMAFAAAVPAVVAAGTREVRERFLLASAGATVGAIALYGTGALNFTVPFGAPRAQVWRLMGFPLGRMMDGDFFDRDRAPILTLAWIASATFLLPLVRSRAPRGALLFVAAASFVTFGRDAFLQAGHAAYALFGIAPPARMMVVMPLAVALSVSIALHELDGRLGLLFGSGDAQGWLRRARHHAPLAACVAALAAFTLVTRWGWIQGQVALRGSLSGSQECGEMTPRGYSTRRAEQWLEGLDRGRFVTDPDSFPEACPSEHGLDLSSPVPLGTNVGGPGSQVGVLGLAFGSLQLAAPGSAERAEALGVRDVLASRAHAPRGPGWSERASQEDTILVERTGGTDFVGVGCVVEEWAGADRLLREALMTELEAGARWLSEPTSLVALSEAPGPIRRRSVERGACDASGARVVEQRMKPGAYAADVSTPSEVDVVIRATYLATWEVRVDGALVPKRRVAPGFVSVRVPAGVHRVEATVQLPAGSLVALFVGCLCLALLGSSRWSRRPATRRAPSPG